MVGDPAPPAPALHRERRALLATMFANGPIELLDFVVPLWAGAALGASAIQVGVLAAVEMAVSVVARPLVGKLADARERRRIAAAGAALYALSCVCYAVATDLALACGAAALGGLGGALFFVAVRAIIGERLPEDAAVYPRLMAAEETGTWIAFVAGLWLLALIDYRGVFLLCAAACLVAAGVLLPGPAAIRGAPRSTADETRLGPGTVSRTLRPMLLAVATTMAAEAAISMLLLFHLQRGLGLAVGVIALVFLPGGIAMSVLPPYLHRLVLRYGRTRVLAIASVSSAVFAASLGWAANLYVIAGLWILSGAARATVVPVQQAVIAEASGGRVGWAWGYTSRPSCWAGSWARSRPACSTTAARGKSHVSSPRR